MDPVVLFMLSKARARFGPKVLEEFFRHSIELCRQVGLLALPHDHLGNSPY